MSRYPGLYAMVQAPAYVHGNTHNHTQMSANMSIMYMCGAVGIQPSEASKQVSGRADERPPAASRHEAHEEQGSSGGYKCSRGLIHKKKGPN